MVKFGCYSWSDSCVIWIFIDLDKENIEIVCMGCCVVCVWWGLCVLCGVFISVIECIVLMFEIVVFRFGLVFIGSVCI